MDADNFAHPEYSEDRLAGRNFPTITDFPVANPQGFGLANVDIMLETFWG